MDARGGGGGRGAHRDGSFEHPKQVLKLKLKDGIVSPVYLVGVRFSYLQMKKKCHGC